jgi:hypothetical protein
MQIADDGGSQRTRQLLAQTTSQADAPSSYPRTESVAIAPEPSAWPAQLAQAKSSKLR